VSAGGKTILTAAAPGGRILDPRAAYLTARMLQGVIESGTAASAWGLGLRQPAGGKTGTTHDSWFAGFTTELVCVVWVGFDDHRDLHIEGAHGALPIWVDVMTQAARLNPYSSARQFRQPAGVDAFLSAARRRHNWVPAEFGILRVLKAAVHGELFNSASVQEKDTFDSLR
jgi:penicillin-binding protein 1B